MAKTLIKICLGSSCFSRGNNNSLEQIKQYLKDNNLKEEVDFRGELCSGNCKHGPVLKINGQIFYEIDQKSIHKILDNHFNNVKQQ